MTQGGSQGARQAIASRPAIFLRLCDAGVDGANGMSAPFRPPRRAGMASRRRAASLHATIDAVDIELSTRPDGPYGFKHDLQLDSGHADRITRPPSPDVASKRQSRIVDSLASRMRKFCERPCEQKWVWYFYIPFLSCAWPVGYSLVKPPKCDQISRFVAGDIKCSRKSY